MVFKPLVSVDEIRQAEADIALAAAATSDTEVRDESVPAAPSVDAVPVPTEMSVRPDARLTLVEPTAIDRLIAKIGFPSRMRRIGNLNRITRTLRLGLAEGLYDARFPSGGKEHQMAVKLHALAQDDKTADDELLVILGWMQAVVCAKCPTVSPARARAA